MGMLLLLTGIGLVILGIAEGEIQVGLVLFFIPYLYGTTSLGSLAILLVFAGLTALVLGSLGSERAPGEGEGAAPLAEDRKEVKKEFGGVVLIGPVPIAFGSSSHAALFALILAACALIALMLVFLLL